MILTLTLWQAILEGDRLPGPQTEHAAFQNVHQMHHRNQLVDTSDAVSLSQAFDAVTQDLHQRLGQSCGRLAGPGDLVAASVTDAAAARTHVST